MAAEFTVIIEPVGNNGVVARIAEVPGVVAEAASAAEARTQVSERLREHLQRERERSLATAAPNAAVERIRVSTAHFGPRKPRKRRSADDRMWDAIWQSLLEQGRIDHIPTKEESEQLARDFKPIKVEGRPISEEIVDARRSGPSGVDLDLLCRLMREGNLTAMGKVLGVAFDEAAVAPAAIQGKPLSEEVIEDRR